MALLAWPFSEIGLVQNTWTILEKQGTQEVKTLTTKKVKKTAHDSL